MSENEEPGVQKEKPRNLLKSSVIVSAMTMLSRVLGLVRDVIFARFIGAQAEADTFYLAFKIPNFFRRLFAEGAFAQAFVPVLSEYREKGDAAQVRHFIDRVAGCLGVSLLGFTTLVVVASPVFTAIFGMGFYFNSPEKFELTSQLLRITFPYLMLISLAGFAGSILNSYDRFAVPAVTPVLLNVCLIVAAAIVSPMLEKPIFALAWGVIAGGVLQLSFQLPFLVRLGLMPHPKVDWGDESIRKVLKLMAPAIFGASVGQINLLFDSILASFLPATGSISWLYYSDRLIELPLGVFAIGIATVVLPNLSRQYSGNGMEQFNKTLDWALRMILIIGIPAALALIVLAEPILYTLFQYGKTTAHDVTMSGLSLQAYSLGLVAFMLIKVLVSGYFSRKDTKTPVKIGIIAMVSNMVLNVLFVFPLYYFWNVGHVGLALATSASAFINAGLLYRGLRQQGVYRPMKGWLRFGLQILTASVCMLLVIFLINQQLASMAQLDWSARILSLSALCFGGLLTYASVLVITGVRLKHLKAGVH